MTDTVSKITSIVAALMPINATITPEMPLWHRDVAFPGRNAPDHWTGENEAALDSLDRVELAMNIEEQFEITVPDDATADYEQFGTIAAIATYVDAAVAKKAASAE